MKKVLMFAVVMLMLFIGCSSEEPVLPEEPKEPEVLEMPTPVETVTYKQAVLDIAALLGQEEEAEDYAAYAGPHGLATGIYEVGWEDPISYRDAAVLLYFAAKNHPERIPMAVVTEEYPEIIVIDEGFDYCILYMYRWGILYGDAPEDWYADIPADEFAEMLLRVETPELRLELLPDMLTQLSWKLDAVYPCACMEEHTEEEMQTAKAGLYTVLAEWEGLQRALDYSYWILEQDDGGVFYLHMFTGMEDGTVSYTQCSYDPATEQGQISASRAPENWNMYNPDAEVIYSVCMADEQKEKLEDGLIAFYLNIADENMWNFRPLRDGYTVAYASPRWDQPVLVLMALFEGELVTHSFSRVGNLGMYSSDAMASSWQQVYSGDFSVSIEALRATTDEARVEQLRQNAMSATFCSCMAREYAQWRVYGRPNTVFEVRKAFADYLIENRETLLKAYFDLLTDTYWIIDRDSEGTYYLQIIGFDGEYRYEKEAVQRVVLAYDGSAVTVHEEAKILTDLLPAFCADSCEEENRKAAEELFASVNSAYLNGFFWRISAMENGGCVLAEFEGKQIPHRNRVVSHYPDGSSYLIAGVNTEEFENPPESITAMLDRVLAMDFSELELGADEVFLLDYLKAFLTDVDELSRWNLPAATIRYNEHFTGVRNTIKLFLEELELNPSLKASFWEMDQWTLHVLGNGKYSVSGIDSTKGRVEVTVQSFRSVGVESWIGPIRQRLQELAETGENSHLVPEELREQFVTFALRDSHYTKELAGKYGSAQWFWSTTESGNVLLEVHSVYHDRLGWPVWYQYDTITLAEVDGTVFEWEYISGELKREPVEEPDDLETVSYMQAMEAIAELAGMDPQELANRVERSSLSAEVYQLGWDGAISHHDAWRMLCRAAQFAPDHLNMTAVTKITPEFDQFIDYDTKTYLYNLYVWGVLIGDVPGDWYAKISAEEFDELLLRVKMPELRMELLPDQLTLLSWKLDEVAYCSCTYGAIYPEQNPAKEGLYTVLSEWEGLERALECSYWILEKKDDVFYLHMFTGMEDGTISYTQCIYDPATEQGQILDDLTPAPCDLNGLETELVCARCMTDAEKELLEEEFLDYYGEYLKKNTEWYPEAYARFLEGYSVAYAWPGREKPALMVINLHEGKLGNEAFGGSCGPMVPSWYAMDNLLIYLEWW